MSDQWWPVYWEGLGGTRPTSCRHEWIIEPPGRPTSVGRCSGCGEERMFENHLNYAFGHDRVGRPRVYRE